MDAYLRACHAQRTAPARARARPRARARARRPAGAPRDTEKARAREAVENLIWIEAAGRALRPSKREAIENPRPI